MKKTLSLIMAIVLCLGCLAGCAGGTKDEETFVVGVCQLMKHDSLDQATQGFIDALTEAVEAQGKKVVIDTQVAGDANLCTTVVNTFVSKKVDLIMANATPALTAAVTSTKDIPILGTSVTEYGVGLGIENFSGTVGGNVSGTSDLAPLDQQGQMILDILPDAKKVGLLYCSAEPNSVYQVEKVKEFLDGKGITTAVYTFSDSSDVALVAQKAAEENDALYVPTDNTAAECSTAIYNAMTTKKPIIAGEQGICKGCGIATLSIDYYDLGFKTGEMAVEILKNGADISTMAIEYTPEEKLTKMYNETICTELGIDVEALKTAGYTAIEQ